MNSSNPSSPVPPQFRGGLLRRAHDRRAEIYPHPRDPVPEPLAQAIVLDPPRLGSGSHHRGRAHRRGALRHHLRDAPARAGPPPRPRLRLPSRAPRGGYAGQSEVRARPVRRRRERVRGATTSPRTAGSSRAAHRPARRRDEAPSSRLHPGTTPASATVAANRSRCAGEPISPAKSSGPPDCQSREQASMNSFAWA